MTVDAGQADDDRRRMNEREMATTSSQRDGTTLVIDVEDHNKRSRRLSYHLDSLIGGGIGDRDDAELAAAENQFSPDEIKLAFEVYEQERSRSAERDEFESIERFIASEKKQGYVERETARWVTFDGLRRHLCTSL